MPSESPLGAPDANGNKGKRPVPTFASFRPKGAPKYQAPSHEDSPIARSASGHQHVSLIASGIRNEPADSDKHVHRDCEDRRERKEKNQHATPHLLVEDPDDGKDKAKLFAVDRVGDPDNLTFGALHRYATPSYFRLGAGNVLGSSQEQRIDRSLSNEKGLILSYREHGLSVRGKRPSLWNPSGGSIRELKIRPQANPLPDVDATVDFVSLSAARRIKRRRGNDGSSLNSESSSLEDSDHYRSIEGKAKSHYKPTDHDLMFNDDASSADDQVERSVSIDESAQDRRVELSRRTEADPGNYRAWLDLINNQDDILKVSRTSKRRGLTNAERRANADIKLSMYQKALEKVTDLEGRENLVLGMIDQAAQVWTSEKLSSQSKSLLQDNPGFLRLWTKYLDFKQTNSTAFKYEEVQTVYFECLEFLSRVQQDDVKSIAEKEQIYEIQLYILLRMTLFLRESGFSELAVAAWQAVLEYVFFKPAHLYSKEHKRGGWLRQTTLSVFEEFWDSEVPRIGENNSEGWATYIHKQGDAPQPKTGESRPIGIVKNLWQSWLLAERRQGLLARKPARTIDDVEENDPYRVILFSDIQPFLIDCPSQISQKALLDAFLAFCYLPTLEIEGSAMKSRLWREDRFLRNESLYSPGSLLPIWGIQNPKPQLLTSDDVDDQDPSLDTSSRTNALNFPASVYQLSSDSLFSLKGSWFSPFDAWETEYSEDQGPLEKSWVFQVVKTLVLAGVGGDNLAELLLALELRLSPDTVRKTSKTLLKRQPSNLRLYNAYALVEYRLGNPGKAETVIVSSINMGKISNELSDTLLLWHTWIWELLSAGRPQDALKRLLQYGNDEVQLNPSEREDQSAKPALILRAEKALTTTRDHLLSHNHPTPAILSISLLILLRYLTTSISLPSAHTVYKTSLPLLPPPPNPSLEHLHQNFARLLHHHTTHHHPYQPSLLRSTLSESISAFPTNTIFLSLHNNYETLNDRVRSIINSTTHLPSSPSPSKKPITTHLFAIYTELHRSLTLGSNTHTIRSAFERAVESEGANCAGLWKLFFLFEYFRGGDGDVGRERAKSVYWRAVRACPWVKELWLLAFEYLREGGMGEEELRGLHEMMEEKGVRVHVGIEEFLLERGGGGGGRGMIG